jgi:hypothetical protein
VAHGYDTRATFNRYAGYYGAIFAAAAVGTLAGLAVFDSGSPAIKEIRGGNELVGVAVGQDGTVYVSDRGAGIVSAISRRTRRSPSSPRASRGRAGSS